MPRMHVMQQEINRLMTNAEGKTRSDSALMVSKKSCAEKEKKQVELEQKSIEQEVQEVVLIGDQEGSEKRKTEKTAVVAEATAEKKAAKIERLKSGFRICKPQGTFLWPSMARNNYNAAASATSNGVTPQVVVQVEDLLVVPTPPSVSSSSALAPPQLPCPPSNHHKPPSPVKPVAERRAVTVTISAMSNDHDHGYSTTTTTTTTTNKSPTSCLDLNDIPSMNPIEEFSGNPSAQKTITTTTTTVTPRLVPDTVPRREMINGPWDVMGGGIGAGSGTWEAAGFCQKKLSKCSSSSASCLSAEVGNWLGLATANSASDESSQG